MEIYQLRSFLEIVRTQNLTRAATNLHISQSALSSQIKQLEEEFGLRLFSRTSKGMVLTDQGRVIQSYAQELVEQSDELLFKAREMAGKVTGTFKVGLNTDGSFLKISRLSRQLTDRFPEVNFIFVSSQTIRTAEMLRQGHIDLGFHFGDNPAADISAEQISTVTIRIAVPEKIMVDLDGLGWESLSRLPWIWSVCDCPYYQIVQAEFDKYGLEPNRVIDAMDEDVVKELVIDGQGVAILRQDDADEVQERGKVQIWGGASFEVPLSISILKQRSADNTVKAVSALIHELWQEDEGEEG